MGKHKDKMSSKEKSKNEQFLQIYLPLGIFILLVVSSSLLVVLNSSTENSNIAHWANISSVIIIFPSLFSTLLWVAIVILIIFGLTKAIKWLPIYISKVYVFIIKVAIFLMNGSNRLVSPLINFRVKFHSLKSIFKKGRK